MRARTHISLKTKLAAALLTIVRPNERGELEPVIDFESAKQMTADQIISLFRFDHGHFHAWGGSDHPANLTPRPIIEHRIKTAKVDVPTIAKSARIARRHEEFRRLMLERVGQAEPAPASSKYVRYAPAMPGSKRSKWKKKMNGKVERRP